LPAEDLTATRARLLQAFWSRRGIDDQLAHASVNCLQQSWPTTVNELVMDELLAEVLQGFPVFPVWFERAMTTTRRQFLFKDYQGRTSRTLSHLAIQCHLNEYAWIEDAEETAAVDRMAANLSGLTSDQVMQVACYRPLASLPGSDALLQKGWVGPVTDVLREQVVAVREEQAIAATLPSLGTIHDEVSQKVQAQYEVNPYPRWRRPAGFAPYKSIFGRALPAEFDLLIAGCGTGRHAIDAALSLPGASVLAVDLSRTSLAYAVRKTRELGYQDRITYAHADILELAESGRTFFMVQSVGVLHHMADPFAGARAVARMVKPGGMLALGLYSARARTHLNPAKALGRRFTAETVKEFRHAITSAPEDDPVYKRVLMSRDFYASSGCRDLLMHVNEHQHSIADIQRILDENDLEFLGFNQFDQFKERYCSMFPHDQDGRDLECWDKFEAAHPAAFARMYQFWTVKRA
jgi:2-polyprenyl-3-methyl-5-hydroxy-6-metoxy-1,4-benzoquinol methylase